MFMGKRDGWAARETSFGQTLTFEKEDIQSHFDEFDIVNWHERDELGGTAMDVTKH